MQPAVIAVGRLKDGPERQLAERYRERFDVLARPLGFARLEVVELPESRARRETDRTAEEATAILARAGPGILVAFDERGTSPASPDLAARIGRWRDEGRPALACIVGGPDGLHPSVRQKADLMVSFGALTLPHALVRVLVLEQLYRALTILAGHPYHRAGA